MGTKTKASGPKKPLKPTKSAAPAAKPQRASRAGRTIMPFIKHALALGVDVLRRDLSGRSADELQRVKKYLRRSSAADPAVQSLYEEIYGEIPVSKARAASGPRRVSTKGLIVLSLSGLGYKQGDVVQVTYDDAGVHIPRAALDAEPDEAPAAEPDDVLTIETEGLDTSAIRNVRVSGEVSA